MRTVYFDCFSGISGDMLLGALIDLGADPVALQNELNGFLPEPVRLEISRQVINGISATDVHVACDVRPPLRHLSDIESIINESTLFPDIKTRSLAIFRNLARNEARVHGSTPEHVHFHEVGAIDTLVDVIGSLLCLKALGISECYSSPIPLSRGMIPMQHGLYPGPGPAVLAILEGVPCYGVDESMELVTPTGAAILREVSQHYGPIPVMQLGPIGYGAGKSRRTGIPNVLRLLSGTITPNMISDQVAVIETTIDDMNPEFFSFLFERFFEIPGALDFVVTPILMKKSRPGFDIRMLVRPDSMQQAIALLVSETSTLGVRWRLENRFLVPREIQEIATPLGSALVKTWKTLDGSVRFAPEYQSCLLLATAEGIPLIECYRIVEASAASLLHR
ncbi:MAG: nickel pincer cofactor biosynthesis protein LarC [Solirubrobacterales bacterium]